MNTRWDPAQYLTFADQRLRPALDLLDRIPLTDPSRIYDLGCGVGNVSRHLVQRWPNAEVTGVDSSPQMLATAGRDGPSSVRWIQADLQSWSPRESASLLYANATLHWLPDHRTLFPRLLQWLVPGGCLAVQMPLSWSLPSHRLMRETLAGTGGSGRRFGDDDLRTRMGHNGVGSASAYYDLLSTACSTLDIWETEYLQVLAGDDPVYGWVRGTGLRPVLQGLKGAELEAFVAEYQQRLRAAYPKRADGSTVYPFRRLFIVATV